MFLKDQVLAFASPMANLHLILTVGFLYPSVSGSFRLCMCIFDRVHGFKTVFLKEMLLLHAEILIECLYSLVTSVGHYCG